MEELTAQTTTAVLERFYDCTDGLIRRVTTDLNGITGHAGGKAEVEISVRDNMKSGEWVNILWTLSGLREFRFSEELNRTNSVISPVGLMVSWYEDRVFLDFSPWTAAPENVQDVRRSDFYLGADKCHWRTLPYSE